MQHKLLPPPSSLVLVLLLLFLLQYDMCGSHGTHVAGEAVSASCY
jgi:hypothetical protein